MATVAPGESVVQSGDPAEPERANQRRPAGPSSAVPPGFHRVTGRVTAMQRQPCSGAAQTTLGTLPVEDAEIRHTFVIHGGPDSSAPIIHTLVTETSGQFEVALKPGTYCVRYVQQAPVPCDPAIYICECVAAKERQCDAVWTVDGPDQVKRLVKVIGEPCGRPSCRRNTKHSSPK